MCEECGCGLPSETPEIHAAPGRPHEHPHAHPHEHEHSHSHEHDHAHGPAHDHEHFHEHPHDHEHPHSPASGHEPPGPAALESRRLLEVRQTILQKNDRQAERNRGFFRARGLLVLNVLSSPGSGKTTLLHQTLQALGRRLPAGVIVGDLATDNDARRLRESGAPVIQITTGTMCHLEAEMVARALKQLDCAGLGLLIIENVGNLVCPAAYDLGEDVRVVLLSVTEGEDKPLKYPPMFQSAQVVILSKIDLAQACGFNRETALANLRKVAPQAKVFEVSAKTGQGMPPWLEFLQARHQAQKLSDPLAVDPGPAH
jgi:hydrogenase nickel incorporation protein HypB